MSVSKPKGHHFVPRFLLQNFASKRESKKTYAYFFRRSTPVSEVNVRNIGKARYFHGDPSVSGLEQKLSSIENSLATFTHRLLSGGRVETDDSLLAAQLVVSCLVRTRNFREGAKRSVAALLRAIPDHLGNLSEEEIQRNLRKATIDAIAKDARFARQWRRFSASQRRFFLSSILGSVSLQDVRSYMRLLGAAFIEGVNLEGMLNESHVTALTKHADFGASDPESRVSMAKDLTWVLLESQTPYILGDIVVIGLRPGGRVLENPLVFSWPLDALCLPISSHCLLVGTRVGYDFSFDTETINIASSELSREFFVSSTSTDREAVYAQRLGMRAELMTDADMKDIFSSS